MKILETRRLIFRRLVQSDFDDLFRLYSDPEIRQYFPDGTRNQAETQEELEWFFNGHPRHPELGLWATIHRETNQFIGRCGLLPWTLKGREEVEVAYLLDKAWWRQGLGHEAAQAIRDYGFNQLKLPRLICMIDPENPASIGVARSIGMTFEEAAEDENGPYLIYACSNPQLSE